MGGKCTNNTRNNEPCWLAGSSKAEGNQSKEPEKEFFVAMTGLGKPVSILDASEKEPGIELKPAGKAATQSGMTEIQQGKAEKGKKLQNHRVLQTKLTAKMPDGTALLLDVPCDTGAETDVVEGNGVETFIDDINVHGSDFQSAFSRLREVFIRLEKWDLRMNGEKTVPNHGCAVRVSWSYC